MFLHYPSVLLNLVLFVPSTRCFAVVELTAKEKTERRIKIAHCYFIEKVPVSAWLAWYIKPGGKFEGIHVDVIVYIFAHLHTTLRTEENLLRPIYTVRLCRIRQAYDRPTTWIVSCKSNLQLAYDCRVGPKSCRRPVASLLYATKSYRVNQPFKRELKQRRRPLGRRQVKSEVMF